MAEPGIERWLKLGFALAIGSVGAIFGAVSESDEPGFPLALIGDRVAVLLELGFEPVEFARWAATARAQIAADYPARTATWDVDVDVRSTQQLIACDLLLTGVLIGRGETEPVQPAADLTSSIRFSVPLPRRAAAAVEERGLDLVAFLSYAAVANAGLVDFYASRVATGGVGMVLAPDLIAADLLLLGIRLGRGEFALELPR